MEFQKDISHKNEWKEVFSAHWPQLSFLYYPPFPASSTPKRVTKQRASCPPCETGRSSFNPGIAGLSRVHKSPLLEDKRFLLH